MSLCIHPAVKKGYKQYFGEREKQECGKALIIDTLGSHDRLTLTKHL